MSCVRKNIFSEMLKSASMKNIGHQVYIHLCQVSRDILYGKCTCKAGCGGCCKHVGAALYRLHFFFI